MNEVIKIHLGRQAFTIAVDAQKELRAYLGAITKQVDDPGVNEEIEIRMAELLTERGISGDKVILPADITYLKEQLGEPKDFNEYDDDAKTSPRATTGKRLFRDPQNAWIGGVAAGLAAYFGIDALLIRLLFVLGTFAWGGSILVYIVLWLLVPEAKSSSDRLQMAGKPITVESLKEAVEHTDIKGAAHRAGETLAEPAGRVRDAINTAVRLIVKLAGIGITVAGLLTLAALAFGGTYLLVHGNIIADNLFPVRLEEHLLVYVAAFVVAMAAVFVVLCGMAVYSHRWPVRNWLTGVLVGLTLIGLVGGSALAADVVPKVHDRYVAQTHSVTRQLEPFTSVVVSGGDMAVDFQTSNTYSVNMKYFGDANTTAIKTSVQNGVLFIDARDFDSHRHCNRLCLPDTYDMVLTVNSPLGSQVSLPDTLGKPILPDPSFQ
jgi:phage shock protein PspC (stress-responsive transcriptional regulator)